MKKILLIGAAIFTVSYLMAAEVKMPAMPQPQLKQVTGTTHAALGPTRYLEFYDYRCYNRTCGEYLKARYADTDNNDVADTGLTLAPLWLRSKYGSAVPVIPRDPGYTTLDGLVIDDFSVPKEYENTSKVLFTWTVRIEGTRLGYAIRHAQCMDWTHCLSYQRHPPGEVHTRLYINGNPYGNVASLTVPGGPDKTFVILSDPMLTGSCLVSKKDFGGRWPKKMLVEVKWYNDTSMNIDSPAKMRNLIVTLIPITATQE